jgi:hypothetical protein
MGLLQTVEVCAAPTKAAVLNMFRKHCGQHKPLNLAVTTSADEVKIAMTEPGMIFWRGLDDRPHRWTKEVPRNSVEEGVKMIRKLGAERRTTEAKRKREAAKHLKELKAEPFVKQMRGLLWGCDTGLLTQNEFVLAFSKFVQVEEKAQFGEAIATYTEAAERD